MAHQQEDSLRLMTRVAMLYYREGMTQQSVATRLGISRPTIGRILTRAEQTGVVTIQINSPVEHVVETEIALEKLFGLTEVVVVAPTELEDVAIRRNLAHACADLIARRVAPGMILGLGWSRTVQYISPYLQGTDVDDFSEHPVVVVQLDGATPPHTGEPHPILGIIAVATELGAEQVLLPAPLFTDTEATAHGLSNDKSVAQAMKFAAKSDLCIFGIGGLSNDTTLFVNGEIDDEVMASLKADGAIGDICGRYFDVEGRPLDNDLARRTMSVPLDVLALRPERVAVVFGTNRVPAILAAVKGGLINGLITDIATARLLLTAPT